jgi:citrate synthase
LSALRQAQALRKINYYAGIVQKGPGFPVTAFADLFSHARPAGRIAQWQEMITDPEFEIGRPRQPFPDATARTVVRIDTNK